VIAVYPGENQSAERGGGATRELQIGKGKKSFKPLSVRNARGLSRRKLKQEEKRWKSLALALTCSLMFGAEQS